MTEKTHSNEAYAILHDSNMFISGASMSITSSLVMTSPLQSPLDSIVPPPKVKQNTMWNK